jgi:hypothetical protein
VLYAIHVDGSVRPVISKEGPSGYALVSAVKVMAWLFAALPTITDAAADRLNRSDLEKSGSTTGMASHRSGAIVNVLRRSKMPGI